MFTFLQDCARSGRPDVAVQNHVGPLLKVRVQLCRNKSSRTLCHDDVRYFLVRILDVYLHGTFPPFNARKNLLVQRHSFDVGGWVCPHQHEQKHEGTKNEENSKNCTKTNEREKRENF